jgi:hypothetical protein
VEVDHISENVFKLMDPKIDFAFKQIFAGKSRESKIVLIALLNAILDRDEDEQITDIIYLNPYIDKPFSKRGEIKHLPSQRYRVPNVIKLICNLVVLTWSK